MEPDEEYASLMLRALDTPPQRPSTVDIGRAMVEGRRRRRTRRLAGLAAAGATVAVVLTGGQFASGGLLPGRPPVAAASPSGVDLPTNAPSIVGQPPPAPTACAVQRLPVPAGEMSTVTGGDSTGRYLVGNSYADNTVYQPTLIWHDGQVRQLDVPGDNQTFTGVNSTGDAVGSSFIDGKRTAFAYVGGRLSKLAGADADAFAISADGIIVGTANGHAVVWRSVSGMPVDLATPPGDWHGMARDIGDDGTIVGTLRSADSEHAYVWRPDGSVSELPVPTVRGVVADASRAYAIRHGWAIGGAARMDASARQPNGKPAPTPTDRVSVRWNVQTGEVQPMPDAGFYAGGVNAYGWVVGWDSKGDALLVSDAGTLTLQPLRKPVQPGDNLAYTISDDGRTIAGQSVLGDAARTMRAVVWHCR